MLPGSRAVIRNQPQIPPLSGKRSRKSLCHVPSPQLVPQHTLPRLAASPPPAVSLQVQISLEDGDNDEIHDHDQGAAGLQAKRPKRRTSMELPRDLVQEHAKSEAREVSNMAATGYHDISTSAAMTLSPRRCAFRGSHEEMKDLRALVRGYCSQSREGRAVCPQAGAIQAWTGYPLTQTFGGERNDRRYILQLLAPVIEEMDQRKVHETKKWQDATGCRVERSRSGKYRYVSLETNRKVKSQEYQRRYRQVLEDEAGMRLERANAWKAKLLSLDKEAYSSSSDDRLPPAALELDEVMEVQEEPGSETPVFVAGEETSMELCDMSVSMDLDQSRIGLAVERTWLETPQATNIDSSSSGDTDDDKNDLEHEPSLQPIQSATDAVCELRPKAVTPTENIETLPLPDRDTSSNDPEIAAAEQRLWSRIDEALQEYSCQVMTIVNSRRNASNTTGQGATTGRSPPT